MIRLTKFDGCEVFLNADWIQSIESTPDTVITLTSGVKLLVRDTCDAVAKLFVEYKQEIQKTPSIIREGKT